MSSFNRTPNSKYPSFSPHCALLTAYDISRRPLTHLHTYYPCCLLSLINTKYRCFMFLTQPPRHELSMVIALPVGTINPTCRHVTSLFSTRVASSVYSLPSFLSFTSHTYVRFFWYFLLLQIPKLIRTHRQYSRSADALLRVEIIT